MKSRERAHLEPYVEDHRAGAVGGQKLAHRIVTENQGVGWMAPAGHVADEIDHDVVVLDRVRDRLGLRGGSIKRLIAAGAHLLSRVELHSLTPQNRVLQLEALMSGVFAKQRLWMALQAVPDPRLEAMREEFVELERRADGQLQTLGQLHVIAVSHMGGPEFPVTKIR